MAKNISNLDKSLKQNITPADIGAAKSSHGTHVTYSTSAPLVAGTASAGSASNVSRGDHVHAAQTSVSGNAGSATKLATARTLTIGSKGKTFDGSANVSWSLSEIGAAASSHNHTHVNKTMITTPIYNASDGILVDFNMNEKSGAMAIIKLYGNSYSANPPIEAIYQFYDYASGDIGNGTGAAISGPAITLKVYRVGGKLKAWFQQPNNYCTFKLEVAYGNNSSTPNVTLSNAAEPTGATQTATITPNRVYSAAYKPTPADIGAATSSHGTHVTWSTTAPKVAGTAAVGTETKVARGDHVHAAQTSVSGNAGTATKLATARTIQIGNKSNTFNGSANISYTLADIGAAPISHGQHAVYGTCETAAGTAEKAITISGSGFSLAAGQMISVKFTASNTASNVKFNVNSTGAKPIWYNNAEYTGNSNRVTGYANAVMTYVYNGSHWVWVSSGVDNNTTYSNVALGHGYATCATAADTVAKVGTLSSYALTKGGIVAVKFTYAVPASATLNINSKGAKSIYFRNAAITANIIKAGDTATFIYDGTYYQLLSIDRWQNDITSHTHNYAGSSSAGGAANTAVKWSTARTLTIGSKGKTVDGSGNVSWTLSEIGAAASSHKHGLLHDNFTVEMASTTTDNGWSMINSSYNGYLLKSIRFGASVPPWAAGGYGSGIAFGGGDTKGILSVQYSSPLVKFAGGNGSKPVWNIGITGTSGTNYNLDDLNSLGGQLTLANGNIGTLSSLQTSNKGNLVAAINEVFQSGVNAKQKLVDALTAKGISASTSNSWDTLIGKLSNIASAEGASNIYAATSLPATGNTNDICIVSSPLPNHIHIGRIKPTSVDANDIWLDTDGTNLSERPYRVITAGKLSTNLRISSAYRLTSTGGYAAQVVAYYWDGSKWVVCCPTITTLKSTGSNSTGSISLGSSSRYNTVQSGGCSVTMKVMEGIQYTGKCTVRVYHYYNYGNSVNTFTYTLYSYNKDGSLNGSGVTKRTTLGDEEYYYFHNVTIPDPGGYIQVLATTSGSNAANDEYNLYMSVGGNKA